MSQSLPPLNALRAFEAAARHNSFSKAAEELHVTRAAISHQIKHLEEFLGVSLVERHARSIELTTAGRAALPKLREGFNNLSDAVHLMRSQTDTRTLSVWMAPAFASKWLLPRMKRFSERHPDIDMVINGDVSLIKDADQGGKSMEDLFRSYNVDVVVRFGSGEYPGCRVSKLFSVDAVPLCSPELTSDDHPHPLRTPEDLIYHTLLHDETPYTGRPNWSKWLGDAGVNGINPDRGLHFNQVSLAMSAAIDAQGVLLSMKPLAKYDIRAGRLCVPFDLALPLEHAYYVITPKAAESNRSEIDAFTAWLSEEIQRDSEN